jgi:hypothetical protein
MTPAEDLRTLLDSALPDAVLATPVPAPASAPRRARTAAPAQTAGQPRHFPNVDANTIRQAFETGRYPYPRPMATPQYEA